MNLKNTACIWTILCATTGAAQTAPDTHDETSQAPESKKEKKPADLPKVSEDVVVSATREARSAADVPVSVTVIPTEALKATPAHTVDDILRDVPSLNLPKTSSLIVVPQSDSFSMRGVGGTRALVQLDGAAVNDPWSGDINWSRIPQASIERIEVARGAAASLYGNYAMSGLVDIVSQPADARRIWASASYGSYDTLRIDANLQQPLSESIGLGVDVDTFDSDGFYRTPADVRGKIDIPFYSSNRVIGMRLDKLTRDNLELFARGSYFDTHISQGSPLAHNQKDGFEGSAGARWKDAFGGELSADLFGIHQTLEMQNSSLVAGHGRDEEVLNNSHETPAQRFGASLQWTRTVSEKVPLVMVGLDGDRILGEDRVRNFTSTGAIRETDQLGGRQDFAGLYAQADYFPDPRFEILASGRVDYWKNFNGHAYSSTKPDAFYPAESTTRFDPRVSIRWDLGKGWALRSAAYRAFGAPTLDQLYEQTTTKTTTTLPNPDLGPETLIGFEAGVDWVQGAFSSEVNLFQNRVTDTITRVTLSSTPTFLTRQQVNVGASRSRGVEIIETGHLGTHWDVNAGYTYNDAKIVDNPPDPTIEGNMIPQIPRDIVTGSVIYRGSAGWTVTLRGRYLSKSYQDASNLQQLDAAVLFDAFVAIPLGSAFDLTLSGENIFDRRYVSDASQGPRIGEPAMFFVGIRLHPFDAAPSRPKRSAG